MAKQLAKGPLTEQEIRNALRHSGFPFELRLLKYFQDAGLDPSIGHRFIPGEGEKSAEVDLIARCSVPLEGHQGFVYLTALIEAKSLGERVAFVGFTAPRPNDHSARHMRIRFSGVPTCQVLADRPESQEFVDLLLGGPTPMAGTLDVLNDPPICPHWSHVRDHTGHKQIEAGKEEHSRESFAKLVRVADWLERDSALALRETPDSPPSLRIQLFLPTIMLATPNLWLYNSVTDEMESSPALILHEQHETRGVIQSRYIDVVSESAVPDFIRRLRTAAQRLAEACNAHCGTLRRIAERQHLPNLAFGPAKNPWS